MFFFKIDYPGCTANGVEHDNTKFTGCYGTGIPVNRRLYCILHRHICDEIMCPGNNTAGKCQANHEEYKPGKRRTFGV